MEIIEITDMTSALKFFDADETRRESLLPDEYKEYADSAKEILIAANKWTDDLQAKYDSIIKEMKDLIIRDATDFFMKDGYQSYHVYDWEEYADIEKMSLEKLGLWNKDLQEKYNMIIEEAKRYI